MPNSTIILMAVTLLIGSLVDGGVIKKPTLEEKPAATEVVNKAREVRSVSNTPQKRPFCNAFTGCGKKRSSPGAANPNYEQMPANNQHQQHDSTNSVETETLNTVFDFNSEPAVADLMQQILSEAKLWEAVQAATNEFKKQQNNRMGHHKFPTFSAQ